MGFLLRCEIFNFYGVICSWTLANKPSVMWRKARGTLDPSSKCARFFLVFFGKNHHVMWFFSWIVCFGYQTERVVCDCWKNVAGCEGRRVGTVVWRVDALASWYSCVSGEFILAYVGWYCYFFLVSDAPCSLYYFSTTIKSCLTIYRLGDAIISYHKSFLLHFIILQRVKNLFIYCDIFHFTAKSVGKLKFNNACIGIVLKSIWISIQINIFFVVSI